MVKEILVVNVVVVANGAFLKNTLFVSRLAYSLYIARVKPVYRVFVAIRTGGEILYDARPYIRVVGVVDTFFKGFNDLFVGEGFFRASVFDVTFG
ncbi:hypothetical protein [Seleniivibrio sp.]|uniref:hypothetical protein n=1 Tax=Seleniivibrio sp. TaxID=2898801 RepID=UPI00341A81C4